MLAAASASVRSDQHAALGVHYLVRIGLAAEGWLLLVGLHGCRGIFRRGKLEILDRVRHLAEVKQVSVVGCVQRRGVLSVTRLRRGLLLLAFNQTIGGRGRRCGRNDRLDAFSIRDSFNSGSHHLPGRKLVLRRFILFVVVALMTEESLQDLVLFLARCAASHPV